MASNVYECNQFLGRHNNKLVFFNARIVVIKISVLCGGFHLRLLILSTVIYSVKFL